MTFIEACELLTEILVGKKPKKKNRKAGKKNWNKDQKKIHKEKEQMNPKVEMIFDIIITSLKLGAGCILLYMMYQFSQGMEAWVELDRIMR